MAWGSASAGFPIEPLLNRRAPAFLTHAAFAILGALLLLAVGQPLFTDDTWWHLALGRAYAEHGPWLVEDPLLFTAPGPPAPAAWLADLSLYGLLSTTGFTGLRVAHVAIVLAILGLAWSLLRRASGSPALASLATSVFAVLSAYRLVQLRPHLLTILAALALYRLVLEDDERPSRARVALATGLLALWANAHAGFVLGPLLLAAGTAALALDAALRSANAGRRSRALGIAAVLVLGGAATLLNPGGLDPHLAYLAAGSETPALARVADEWARVDPFRWPPAGLPPTPLDWGLVWLLLLAVPVVTVAAALRGRGASIDPVLVGIATLSAVLLFSAVRFLWLGIFPLLLLCRGLRALRVTERHPTVAVWATAGCAVLLVPGFVRLGALPMLTRAMPVSWAGYATPYPAAKYFAHAVWLLDDAGLEGNLFNDYFMGGFAGYWLAPEVRTFANGTLNIAPEAMAANLPLRERRGARPDEDFLESLDRLEVDLFLGIRLPETGNPGRPWFYTTGHLENAPGWIPVFRNLRSALYLRANARNEENLRRVAEHYAREGVPFDPVDGFDPERVLREALPWAVAHGLVPYGFRELVAASHDVDETRRAAALDRLASLYATLALYERAARADRRSLRADVRAAAPRRRLVWSLLRDGRVDEAREEAAWLDEAARDDPVTAAVAGAARTARPSDRFDRLPVFSRGEASRLLEGYVQPAARTAVTSSRPADLP